MTDHGLMQGLRWGKVTQGWRISTTGTLSLVPVSPSKDPQELLVSDAALSYSAFACMSMYHV